MNDLEQKRKRIELGVKLAALAAIGFFVAPVIFVAVKGIIGLALAAGVGLVGINMAPWFSAKVANWRLKAIKHEAAQNPIPTLENEYMSRARKLGDYEQALRGLLASVNAFKSKLASAKEKFPKDAAIFDEQYAKMRQLYEMRAKKLGEATTELGKFKSNIDKAKIIWDLGQEAKKMNDAAGVGDEELIAQIQTETALDSVQKSLDMAFADLEISLLEDSAKTPTAAIADGLETQTKQTERAKIQI